MASPDRSSKLFQVQKYTLGHGHLLIRSVKGDFLTGLEHFYSFAGVIFYSGPLQWIGNGMVRNNSDRAEVISNLSVQMSAEFSAEALDSTSGYIVFEFDTPSRSVRIVASSVKESEEHPEIVQ